MLLRICIASIAIAGCGANVTVEDDAVACITWDDPARTVEQAQPHEGWGCASGRRGDFGAVFGDDVVPTGGTWTRTYVCTSSPDGVCDVALDVARLEECFKWEEGDGCKPGWGGGCHQRFLWSLCGPDPETLGGCCYDAIVADSTYYE